jgi:hypothetical protein
LIAQTSCIYVTTIVITWKYNNVNNYEKKALIFKNLETSFEDKMVQAFNSSRAEKLGKKLRPISKCHESSSFGWENVRPKLVVPASLPNGARAVVCILNIVKNFILV